MTGKFQFEVSELGDRSMETIESAEEREKQKILKYSGAWGGTERLDIHVYGDPAKETESEAEKYLKK